MASVYRSNSNTQSGSPELFLPGAVNCWVAALENGEPTMEVNVLALGSNQRAVTPFCRRNGLESISRFQHVSEPDDHRLQKKGLPGRVSKMRPPLGPP
jgi:hypothetical protein